MASFARPAIAPVLPAARWRVRGVDVAVVLAANGVLIAGMWVRHGGLDQLGSIAGVSMATGQLTALFGTYLALIQIVLMSRTPWLERRFGRDGLTAAHRWIGFATVWLLVAHGVFTTTGFAIAEGSSVLGEAWTLVTTWDFVLMATVSLALFVAVAVTSVRLARRRLSYESWYGLHLYVYLAVALGFAHQLVVGTDFVDDPVARVYWVGLYVVTIGLLVAFRVGTPIARNLRHRFRVVNVVHESEDVVSIYLGGRELDRFAVRAGQYLVVRFLTDGWWRAHPYSISAQPNGRWLRLTVKALGDDSARLGDLAVGTRAIIEGPYGNLTADRRASARVTLVAGGIGLTPLRALVEELSAAVPVTLLYRAHDATDLIFRRELDLLAERRGVMVRYLVGPRGARRRVAGDDPLDRASIAAMVPDIADHDVYVCGPPGLMSSVTRTLRSLGVPPNRIHQERFDT